MKLEKYDYVRYFLIMGENMLQVVYEKCLVDDLFLRKIILGKEIERVFLEKDTEKSLEELDNLRKEIARFFSCDNVGDFVYQLEQDETLMDHALDYSRQAIAFILTYYLTDGLASVVWVT